MAHEFECRDEAQGRACRLRVRAQPGARREGLAGTWNGMLKLAVSAPPEDGRANDSLARLLCELLDLRRNQVALVAGERARNKEFRVELSCPQVRTRLAERLDPDTKNP
ncbi:MAG: DUF167 domain-containing protein [Planctomycetes bacterium]|nr:DUF167 domain-containing protein [Planctomycetota bacterium]